MPDRPDAEFPVATDDPLLPQPRPDPGGRPARSGGPWPVARATYAEKIVGAALPDKRVNTPVRCRARRRRRARGRTDGAPSAVSTRWCWLRIPTIPGAAARGRHPDERAHAGRHPLPAQPRRAAHRCHGAAERRMAWAAWNYGVRPPPTESRPVCLHYLLNRLQPLPGQPVVVSLTRCATSASTSSASEYAHPGVRPGRHPPRRLADGRPGAGSTPGSAARGRAMASRGRARRPAWRAACSTVAGADDAARGDDRMRPPVRAQDRNFGQVRHAPARHHAMPTPPDVLLMLLMRSLRQARQPARSGGHNRRRGHPGFDRDHGDGCQWRAVAGRWPAARRRHPRRHGRGGCTPTRACWATPSPVSFWYCHRADGGLRPWSG